jgi:hypothetical protein
MVGRLLISLNEVLGTISLVVCGDMPVCNTPSGSYTWMRRCLLRKTQPTIGVYKASISRMVGRIMVSLNEVLGTISHVVCGDMTV